MRALIWLLVFAVALSSTGCGSAGRRSGPLAPRAPDTTVRVDNRNFLDMTIYVLRGSQRVRLGMAPGVSRSTFRIPDSLMFGTTTLRFQMDAIGGNVAPISHEIMAQAGDQIELVIP